jgi:hypothetical protein
VGGSLTAMPGLSDMIDVWNELSFLLFSPLFHSYIQYKSEKEKIIIFPRYVCVGYSGVTDHWHAPMATQDRCSTGWSWRWRQVNIIWYC